METILFCPKSSRKKEAHQLSRTAELIEILKEVYQKLAYRDITEGIFGCSQNQIPAVIGFEIILKIL